MILPKDVKCTFCDKIFCCSKCRQKHELNTHGTDLERKQMNDDFQKNCMICLGKNLPFNTDLKNFPKPLIDHISNCHLPLRCNKCLKLFVTEMDFEKAHKCSVPDDVASSKQGKDPEKKETDIKASLTPLSKINLRWRRKSKTFESGSGSETEFLMQSKQSTDVPVSPVKTLVRSTSTPMQSQFLISKNFADSSYNASSIRCSSINFTSSTSSESDVNSPTGEPNRKEGIPLSPKNVRNKQYENVGRSKLAAHATPLRQVMSKSIQRAIANHITIQQGKNTDHHQKLSFGSSDKTIQNNASTSSPLDLRTSPAIRRFNSDGSNKSNIKENINCKNANVTTVNCKKTVYARYFKNEMNGETKQQIVITENVAEEIKVQIPDERDQNTPRITITMLPKKTISFETPSYLNHETDNTMAIPKRDAKSQSTSELQTTNGDDDVFYTPMTTPNKSVSRNNDIIDENEEYTDEEVSALTSEDTSENSKSLQEINTDINLWNVVTSVLRYASKKDEAVDDDNDDVKEGREKKSWKFNFQKYGLLQKAASFADYIKKSLTTEENDIQPILKRRRISSNTDSIGVLSPLKKRQKIRGRKPINRMRHE